MKGKKGYPYYQITQKGITELRKRGYNALGNEDILRIHEKAIPYYVEVSRIALSTTPYRWIFKDSRAIKKEMHLNRGDQIHGSLTSPEGKEYGFYVLESATTEINMRKTIREIAYLSNRVNRSKTLRHFIIFAKGQESMTHFIEKANEEQFDHRGEIIRERLRPSGTVGVLPLNYGIAYLQSKLSDKNYFESVFKVAGSPIPWVAPSDEMHFEFKARYKDEEVYVVNLLDGDISKINAIQFYLSDSNRRTRFGEKSRKLVLITDERMEDFHMKVIGKRPKIEWFPFSCSKVDKSKREMPDLNMEPALV
ncbi:hypothetical protein GCM10011391_38830 [Pullulanibacillus camelliae]|uniref:Uncharacterized protein n=1 Tax=Pullulanibacillus camelliae TaxID=1707096 RepID=A0A8J3E109_9BACL|nr:hypothetical protein GCM10011391_38830 [Pullulanibacillus camelliae]